MVKTSFLILIGLISCFIHQGCKRADRVPVPKPRGFFRIDFPERAYQTHQGSCPYRFEYPVYARFNAYTRANAEPCWADIRFEPFRATLHITYKKIDNNLGHFTEDVRTFANKHIPKADDIIETPVALRDKQVYGVVYEIRGNVASSVNFYLTDSILNFFSAALYFEARPNKDSLAPVIAFLNEDIKHLIKTFEWR